MKAKISQLSIVFFVMSLFLVTTTSAQEKTEKSAKKEFKVSAKVLKKYVGTYNFDQGISADISYKDGKIYGTQVGSGQPPMHLFAVSKTKFELREMGAEIEFSFNDKGEVTGLTFFQQGQEMFGSKE